jgi:hypothetical protein
VAGLDCEFAGMANSVSDKRKTTTYFNMDRAP